MSAGFLALLDDVAAIMAKAAANTKIVAGTLDDVATMTGAGVKGASAIVIDDIPVNSQAVVQFEIDAKREIPIIKAIEKGSLINKAIAIPLAVGLDVFAPFLLTPILAIGGTYLAFEGAEKVIHALKVRFSKTHHDDEARPETAKSQDEFEQNLIKGAIRTDLVMSIEIIFIAMASINELMPDAHWGLQLPALIVVGFLVTKIIYRLVMGLVRLDDLALHLVATARENKVGLYKRKLAAFIVKASPILMKTMSVVGTAAMIFIGGELIAMEFISITEFFHHHLPHSFATLTHFLAYSIVGFIIGGAVVAFTEIVKRVMLWRK
ncbi:MAG TPA: DUF808 family protein [Alphaproteobacteria bacterium]|nr:DUF808 family protein [Alphaproteobacteria bacterium]HNS44449.1 DUF808 family protein [Alphaproteobacteria bacterium]